MSESQEQIALFKMIRLQNWNKYPLLEWIYHVPNGGLRHKAVAKKLKAEGVQAGVLDINVDVPKLENIGLEYRIDIITIPGLRIEMKYGKNKPTVDQKRWIKHLLESGYRVEVCYTWVDAWNHICDYLGYDELKQGG